MEILMSTLMQAIADFLLPMCRVSGMLMIMAGLGVRNIPTRIKTGLVVLITIVMMPMLPKTIYPDLISFAMVLEVILQLTIGFALVALDLIMLIRHGKPFRRDPWEAGTLEWATPTPPPMQKP